MMTMLGRSHHLPGPVPMPFVSEFFISEFVENKTSWIFPFVLQLIEHCLKTSLLHFVFGETGDRLPIMDV